TRLARAAGNALRHEIHQRATQSSRRDGRQPVLTWGLRPPRGQQFLSWVYLLLAMAGWKASPAYSDEDLPPENKVLMVGSKKFTENVLLGEAATQVANHAGVTAEHHADLGGARVLWNALLAGEIYIYPEYTGTVIQEILGDASLRADAVLRQR